MKVWVASSELWPCYRVSNVSSYHEFDEEIDISEEDYVRYRRVIDEFFAVQRELAKFFPGDCE